MWRAASGNDWDLAGRRLVGEVLVDADGDGSINELRFREEIKYDNDDRVTAVVWPHGREGADSDAQSYSYDEPGRLKEFKQGRWDAPSQQVNVITRSHDWALDELGNWRRRHDNASTHLDPAIDGSNNAYTQWAEDANGDGTAEQRGLEYDAARGFLWRRQIADNLWVRYIHDGLGRLTEVQRETQTQTTTLVSFGYDAAGRLAWRVDAAGERTDFVYDGGNLLQEIVDTVVQQEYAWAGGQLVKTITSTGARHHLHQDRLGSVVLATQKQADANGSILQTGQAAYDAYGRPSPPPAWGPNNLPVAFGFAGARWEAWDEDGDGTLEQTEGLYLMGARWYDPTLGRFLEQDPIGEAGGLNLYAYVGSSPTLWVDPSGLSPNPIGSLRSINSTSWGSASYGAFGTPGSSSMQYFVNGVQVSESTFWADHNILSGVTSTPDVGDKASAAEGQADAAATGKQAENNPADGVSAGTASQGATQTPPQGHVTTTTIIGGTTVTGENQGDAGRCVDSLAKESNMTLSLDDYGLLQYETPANPTPTQQLVMDAANSQSQISIHCSSTPNPDVFFGGTDHQGGHDVDLHDTKVLGGDRNKSSFTEGRVVLHELAEGYAETHGYGREANFQKAHAYANRFAPGIDASHARVSPLSENTHFQVMNILIQDGSGQRLGVRVQFPSAVDGMLMRFTRGTLVSAWSYY